MAILEGFQNVIQQRPLHKPKEIAEIHSKSRRYFITYPFLIAIDQIARNSRESFLKLPENVLKTALAYRLFQSLENDLLDWDDWLFSEKQLLAAEILHEIWIFQLKTGRTEHLTRLYDYDNEKNDPIAPVAAKVILDLLNRNIEIPKNILRDMLAIMLRHIADRDLLTVAARNLRRKKITNVQRAPFDSANRARRDVGVLRHASRRKTWEMAIRPIGHHVSHCCYFANIGSTD